MKRFPVFLLLLAGILCLAFASCAAETAEPAPAADEPAEWTVLFYFCGSDLESKYSYASENLDEIFQVGPLDDFLSFFIQLYSENSTEYPTVTVRRPEEINILLETGGSAKWHAQDLGMDISADALQRWHYSYYYSSYLDREELRNFELMETCPLASMASADTLADFIRWGTQNYPAKKYALVLWDHGGGALTGLFIDELFKGDVMYLPELTQALADGGVTFEAVLIDACMMANLETAWAIKDYASWMIASEEVVPGNGTAVYDWLQELVYRPEMDGRQLGRNICDMTMAKYANLDNQMAKSTLTWSVIDLSKIETVADRLDFFFENMGDYYKDYPLLSMWYAQLLLSAEEYGDGAQDMRDIAGILYGSAAASFVDPDVRNSLLDALSDAVVYSAHGAGRSGARGLSFCYPIDCSSSELDIYARNCPCNHYLALLDAVTGWTAPDSVYENVDPLPDINTVKALEIKLNLIWTENNFPGISIDVDVVNNGGIYYRLYRLDETTGQEVCLGRSDCSILGVTSESSFYQANEPWIWPCIDNAPCAMDLLLLQYSSEGQLRLYNIPIQIGSDNYFLRCGRLDPYDKTQNRSYEVYGIWENYDDNSKMVNRNVIKLSQMAGREYCLLAPLKTASKSEKETYVSSGPVSRMYRALDVVEAPLPAGTYYLEYEVDDLFMRSYTLERFEMKWDGEKLTLPDDLVWEGSVVLQWNPE